MVQPLSSSLPSRAVCKPEVFAVVRSPLAMVGCLKSVGLKLGVASAKPGGNGCAKAAVVVQSSCHLMQSIEIGWGAISQVVQLLRHKGSCGGCLAVAGVVGRKQGHNSCEGRLLLSTVKPTAVAVALETGLCASIVL